MWRAAFPPKRRRRSALVPGPLPSQADLASASADSAPPGRLGWLQRGAAGILNRIQRADRIWLPALTLVVVLVGVALALLLNAQPQIPCVLRDRIEISDLQPYWVMVRQWCPMIMSSGQRYQLDPHLIAALILVESGGDAQAYSSDGAVGLMQIMPRDGIAAQVMCPGGPCFAHRPSIAELQDPAFNVDYGSRLLHDNVINTGSLREALRAYGPLYVGYDYADLVLKTYDAVRQ